MASFANDPDEWQRLDWQLLQNGFVTVCWRHSVFAEIQKNLAGDGYTHINLDAARWTSDAALYDDISAAFAFPDYFGRNLNAVVDCLRDVATHDYGSDSNATGTVVAIGNIDALNRRDAQLAHRLLDILADTGRQALLIGHRFIVLAQSDDPKLVFPPVGATGVSWNQSARLNSARGL